METRRAAESESEARVMLMSLDKDQAELEAFFTPPEPRSPEACADKLAALFTPEEVSLAITDGSGVAMAGLCRVRGWAWSRLWRACLILLLAGS